MPTTATFTQTADRGRTRVGNQYRVKGTLSLTGTYDATKIPLTAGMFGLGRIADVEPKTAVNGAASVVLWWDSANSRMQAYNTAAAVSTPFAEVGATSLTGYTAEVTVYGN